MIYRRGLLYLSTVTGMTLVAIAQLFVSGLIACAMKATLRR